MTKSDCAFYDRFVTVAAVENILKQPRSAIIELLKANGAMSVERLAGELEMSKVCVRRHLGLLESDGLVTFEEERHDRGRPRFIYRLTEKAARLFPQIYDEFAKDALAQVRRNFGDDALRRVLRSRADELIAQFEEKLDGRNFDERVKSLTGEINTKGYLADARRLKDGSYRLRQRNCPIESVAVAYPQVCDEELRVYREVLGCEVVCECRIADGARKCDFHIAAPRLTQISRRAPER
ncbi:MAG TPA: metalloregulator ArsR/SmtB family transcription factor [Blastocatellia bacterium]|nr:metalloregulator ArsR/SmtB family transcription factor [Blastocatellia bacterium]